MQFPYRLAVGVLAATALLAGASSAGAAIEPGTVPGSCDPKFATCMDDPKAGCDHVMSCQPPGTMVKSTHCSVRDDGVMQCRD